MLCRAPTIFALVMIVSTTSFAASSQKDGVPDCKSPVTQLDMNMCASDAYKQSDKRLNDLYNKKIQTLLSASTKKQFKAAQKSWLSFRDKSCEYEASPWEGGSGQPMIRLECLKKFTDQRIKDIELYLSCTQDGCPN